MVETTDGGVIIVGNADGGVIMVETADGGKLLNGSVVIDTTDTDLVNEAAGKRSKSSFSDLPGAMF